MMVMVVVTVVMMVVTIWSRAAFATTVAAPATVSF